MKNLSFKMVIVYAFFLIAISVGCATIEPVQMKEVAVQFVKEVVQWRMKGTEYKQYSFYLYTDRQGTQYTLERYQGEIALINIQK